MTDREILPGTFVPSHYNLRITNLDFAKWQFQGSVDIEGRLAESSKDIVLNALELDISSATLEVEKKPGATEAFTAAGIVYDEKQQRAVLSFGGDKALPTSDKATLHLSFQGLLNHDLAGFYRSQYRPPAGAEGQVAPSTPRDSDYHYMLSTQFEACDARRAFPCFDEPRLKATFDFAITIPADLVALSNMPVVKEEETKEKKTKTITFARTPRMSTYLLAWAVGDFEYVEAHTKRTYADGQTLPVRVYATRGMAEQGRWALQHAPAYIDLFSERFGVDYPLPKSDILAVAEFTHGAMENWGLVTYRQTAILFDEQQSEGRSRNRIAYIVAHELAHQWFGNLVTMDWWDELWLNEGFATWAGWLAVEALHPDWDVWPQFVHEGLDKALRLDGLRSSHPIQVPVRDALEVNQVFDAISYLKGCSVIRMLAAHLGTDTFFAGVSAYLKRHRYGNATTSALWTALTDASGHDVHALMSSWIGRMGFPVVTIGETASATQKDIVELAVRQSRFLSAGDVKPAEDETLWWVPLGPKGAVDKTEETSLTTRETSLRVHSDFYLLNDGATGFYRVQYPPERLARLGTQLDRLGPADKISLVGSAAELAFSGHGSTAALLALLEGYARETHLRVAGQALDALEQVASVFGDEADIKSGLQAFARKLLEPAIAAVDAAHFAVDAPVTGDIAELRKRLRIAAILSGHADVTAACHARYTAWVADSTAHPVRGDDRVPVFLAAIVTDPEATVPVLLQEWRTTAAVDGREVLTGVLGRTSSSSVVDAQLLPFLFSDVPPGDVHFMATGLAAQTEPRTHLWSYMQREWDGAVAARIGGNPVLLDRFVGIALSKFTDLAALAEIDAFFANRSTAGFDRTLATVRDSIRGRAAYRTRDSAALRQWLTSHGYIKA